MRSIGLCRTCRALQGYDMHDEDAETEADNIDIDVEHKAWRSTSCMDWSSRVEGFEIRWV